MPNPFQHPTQNNLIGLFNDSFPPILDGVTLTVENYAHWLAEKGQTPCVVTPWNPERIRTPYSVMRFFSLPIRSRHPYRYGYPKLDPFIWKRLRDTDFKLVHSHCPFSSGRLAVYVKKHQHVPLIGTFHSKYRQDLEHSFRRMPWCVPIIMKRILDFFNACDEVWIPQAQVEETVRQYGYKGPLQVVENGNDFADIAGEDILAYKEGAKRRLGRDPRCINLLFVGQHIWEKGLRTIVDTLHELHKTEAAGHPSFHIDFIGTGYAASELESTVGRLGLTDRVTFNGIVRDRRKLSDFYAAADLFIFPSMYDNAPLVVREAAAMGTPSLLLEGSTAAEVVSDGVNGFLVPPDAVHMADLIAALDRDRDSLRRVALGARNSLVRSWRDVVDEVADRYDTVIKKHNRHTHSF